MTLALEQDAESLEDIGLVIGDQDTAHGITMNRISGGASIPARRIGRQMRRAISLGRPRRCEMRPRKNSFARSGLAGDAAIVHARWRLVLPHQRPLNPPRLSTPASSTAATISIISGGCRPAASTSFTSTQPSTRIATTNMPVRLGPSGARQRRSAVSKLRPVLRRGRTRYAFLPDNSPRLPPQCGLSGGCRKHPFRISRLRLRRSAL
jgi:hypothetical protein